MIHDTEDGHDGNFQTDDVLEMVDSATYHKADGNHIGDL